MSTTWPPVTREYDDGLEMVVSFLVFSPWVIWVTLGLHLGCFLPSVIFVVTTRAAETRVPFLALLRHQEADYIQGTVRFGMFGHYNGVLLCVKNERDELEFSTSKISI